MKYLKIFENQRKQWSTELEKDEWYFSSFRDNLITSLEVEDYNECIDDLIIILKSENLNVVYEKSLYLFVFSLLGTQNNLSFTF